MTFVCNFLWWIFFGIFAQVGMVIFLDLTLSSVRFVIMGDMLSVFQSAITNSIGVIDAFDDQNWRVASGLRGIDKILNWFLGLQYTFSGRWLLLGISAGLCCLIPILAAFKDIEINMGDIQTQDLPAVGTFGMLLAHVAIAPMLYGGIFGVFASLISFFQ